MERCRGHRQHRLCLQMLAAASNGQLTADVTKANARAEENAGHPGPDCNAFLRDAGCQPVLPQRIVQDRDRRSGRIGRGRHQVRSKSQDDAHSHQSDGSRHDEAGFGPINQIPEDGIDEGKGRRRLRSGLPG